MEVDTIPQQVRKSIDEVGRADIVVGVFSELTEDAMAVLCESLQSLSNWPRVVVLQREPSNASTSFATLGTENGPVTRIPWQLPGTSAGESPLHSISAAYRSTFEVAERLGASSCMVAASNAGSAMPQWVRALIRPLLEDACELVTPCYARLKFEGLLNSSIVYPLTRSLYGRKMFQPLGPDLGFSRALFQKLSNSSQNGSVPIPFMNPLISLAPTALCADLKVCQVHLGARNSPPTDWTNVSSILAQVLGPVFLLAERNAACWQRIRGSRPVTTVGSSVTVTQNAGEVEVGRMVNSFLLGARDLRDIWALVLPPATLFELTKLARVTPEQFHMPDELWVRIVYDFALAHRLQTINRDHLLRSLTPLYLGWVASYAREVEVAPMAAVEQRLERLALAYEASKPYLVSRWRWPDRFNP